MSTLDHLPDGWRDAEGIEESTSLWTSLEIAKLVVAALTPVLILVVTVVVNIEIRRSDAAAREVDLRRQESQQRQTAVENLSRLMYERRTRGVMLASSLRREAPLAEVRERKNQYDESYVRWNANEQSNMFQVRRILGSPEYSELERIIESDLVVALFKPIDACLTAAYDQRLRGQNVARTLDSCQIDRLLAGALKCTGSLAYELFQLAWGQSGVAPAVNLTVLREDCMNDLSAQR